ncbi:MAG: DUF3823 domain-containing protein [Prevotella sp.]|nr:DUF3823 domain-containing protein [Prevotella sp.]
MKISFSIILQAVLFLFLFTSCGTDNYDAPESLLVGKVVYKDEPIQVRGTDERVRLQLYQDGYQNYTPIEVFVTQDGSFSAKLFDGEYKMVTRDNNGPWVNSRDTTYITVRGNTVQNMEVIPYFTITNADMKLSGRKVTANFTVNQIVENRRIERILLLVNRTQFVDDDIRIDRIDYTDSDAKTGTLSYSFDINDEANNSATLFGRICVWTEGADQGIYSPVFLLK